MRLTEQALAERKDKILDTAYQLFYKFSVDSVTLAQIAKEANVGASAIYRYFQTKSNLLWHTQKILWEEIVEQIHADGQEDLSAAKNGFEEISILLHCFKVLYSQHSNYLLFANDYKMYLARNHIMLPKRAYDLLMKPVYDVFQSALKRGHEDGSINGKESVEDQFFAIWGIMRGFAEQLVIYGKVYEGANPWEARFDLVYRYTLKALKTERQDAAFSNL